jgi:predicted transport protein
VSDIRLFRVGVGPATEMKGVGSDLEKPLQMLIEKNLEELLGVRFLSTEYSTGKKHAGRIDTLGLDENNCPVILEYKRSSGENVINQGLSYLDWLMDHQAEFKLLVLDRYGKSAADAIDWAARRVICIAADFTKYDAHAVQQMERDIQLIRYRKFEGELLLLELVNPPISKGNVGARPATKTGTPGKSAGKRAAGNIAGQYPIELSDQMRILFGSLEGYLLSLGDDVQRKDLKLYTAFKRIKNFLTVEVRKQKLLLYLRLNPDNVDLTEGFSRDVRGIEHWGTGDVEIVLKDQVDPDRAKQMIRMAYVGGSAAA